MIILLHIVLSLAFPSIVIYDIHRIHRENKQEQQYELYISDTCEDNLYNHNDSLLSVTEP
jgi:hypothetical protein